MTTHPLGRLVNHDPGSRAFPSPYRLTTHRPVTHRIYGPCLNQGVVGSCVGNTGVEAANSTTLHVVRTSVLGENTARRWYAGATAIDPFPGTWVDDGTPNGSGDDTGTDMNSVAKMMRQDGRIVEWRHVFDWDSFLAALQAQVVAVGIWWDTSMMETDAAGYVHPNGKIAGGHEILARGDDPRRERVKLRNHWWEDGRPWGALGNGDFWMTYADLKAKLADQGDATVFVKPAALPPLA